jgi:hypothetical protein
MRKHLWEVRIEADLNHEELLILTEKPNAEDAVTCAQRCRTFKQFRKDSGPTQITRVTYEGLIDN